MQVIHDNSVEPNPVHHMRKEANKAGRTNLESRKGSLIRRVNSLSRAHAHVNTFTEAHPAPHASPAPPPSHAPAATAAPKKGIARRGSKYKYLKYKTKYLALKKMKGL